ncbi:hypothetical protein BJ875DRAFT_485165 [Amylocarpus encephaloides]|uniref:LITAF domain-containing protein n=1 Tax=Amylocarpus encephaloides TaxID=45428 RepID=A0A9P7YH33_9HELO|nr:hypothetical protein BJ875DRAFT_485165 [Amylocarpus encephaloides]
MALPQEPPQQAPPPASLLAQLQALLQALPQAPPQAPPQATPPASPPAPPQTPPQEPPQAYIQAPEKQSWDVLPPGLGGGLIFTPPIIPLAALEARPEPVECPACGTFDITLCTNRFGIETQYVSYVGTFIAV